jgi:hypothetical protein
MCATRQPTPLLLTAKQDAEAADRGHFTPDRYENQEWPNDRELVENVRGKHRQDEKGAAGEVAHPANVAGKRGRVELEEIVEQAAQPSSAARRRK